MIFNTSLKDESIFEFPDKLYQDIKNLGKEKYLDSFFKNIPMEMYNPLKEFFKELKETEYFEFAKLFYSKSCIEEILVNDYEVLPIGKKLFNIEPKGLGKMEIFIACSVINSKIHGGGNNHDLSIIGKDTKYEIKVYLTDNKGKPLNESAPIRLGKDGKVTKFKFWVDITSTLHLIESNDFSIFNSESLNSIINEIKEKSDDIISGEFSKTVQTLFEDFYSLIKELTDDKCHKGVYESICFMSNSGETQYFKSTIKDPKNGDEIKIKLEKANPLSILIHNLRKIKYTNDPSLLKKDLQDAVNEISSDKMFINVRPNRLNITNRFVYSCISQGGIKVIEEEFILRKQEEYNQRIQLKLEEQEYKNYVKKLKEYYKQLENEILLINKSIKKLNLSIEKSFKLIVKEASKKPKQVKTKKALQKVEL